MKNALFILVASAVFVIVALYFEKTYVAQGAHACAEGGTPTLLLCWREVLVRSVLHLVGSFVIVLLLHTSKNFLRLSLVLSLGIVIMLYFGFQEFYIHPVNYDQPFFKSVIDFLVWNIPIGVYLVIQATKART